MNNKNLNQLKLEVLKYRLRDRNNYLKIFKESDKNNFIRLLRDNNIIVKLNDKVLLAEDISKGLAINMLPYGRNTVYLSTFDGDNLDEIDYNYFLSLYDDDDDEFDLEVNIDFKDKEDEWDEIDNLIFEEGSKFDEFEIDEDDNDEDEIDYLDFGSPIIPKPLDNNIVGLKSIKKVKGTEYYILEDKDVMMILNSNKTNIMLEIKNILIDIINISTDDDIKNSKNLSILIRKAEEDKNDIHGE